VYKIHRYDVFNHYEDYAFGIQIDDSPNRLAVVPKHWSVEKTLIEELEELVEKANKSSEYSPIEVATALALYGYNVGAVERAEKIYKYFDSNCADMDDLVRCMMNYGSAAIALPFPSAEIYVQHALEKYGEEAKRRVQMEREVSTYEANPPRVAGAKVSWITREGKIK
jgi:hypothetical protein